ncbi:hypothetical protein MRX96_041138 [Rhipicephalus microplus]
MAPLPPLVAAQKAQISRLPEHAASKRLRVRRLPGAVPDARDFSTAISRGCFTAGGPGKMAPRNHVATGFSHLVASGASCSSGISDPAASRGCGSSLELNSSNCRGCSTTQGPACTDS